MLQFQISKTVIHYSNTAVLQFYFESFDYERHTIKRETLIEFLCEYSGSSLKHKVYVFLTQFCFGGLIKLARFLLNSFLFFEGDLTTTFYS